MRRRWHGPERPPLPGWMLDGTPIPPGLVSAWCIENGYYSAVEVIRMRRAARRARAGIDAAA